MSQDTSASALAAVASGPPIVVCGTLAIDMIGHYGSSFARVAAQQVLSISMQLERFALEFGGCAMNICYTLALLGAQPFPIVRAGRDFDDGYAQHLARVGIDASGVLVDERFASSSRCVILSDAQGNQLTAFYPGSSAAQASRERPHANAGDLAQRVGATLAIIAPDVPETMLQHAQHLRAAQIPFITDPGQGLADFSTKHLRDLLQLTSRLVVNASEWQVIQRLLGAAATRLTDNLRWLVITHGGDGVELRVRGQPPLRLGAVPPRAFVDHSGCGDALRAGLVFGMALGAALPDALRIGMLAATFNLEASGCQRHQFSMHEFTARFSAEFGLPWPLDNPNGGTESR